MMHLSLWKNKRPDYRMASAGNKHLGTGERLFCFRRIRLCLDWGFDPITAITGAPLMESMEQRGRAAAWCVPLPSSHSMALCTQGFVPFIFTAGPVALQQKPLGFSHPRFGEAKETVT